MCIRDRLWIGKEKYSHFTGKKLCFLDDVVSTGGTIEAVLALAKEIGIETVSYTHLCRMRSGVAMPFTRDSSRRF